MSAEYERLRDVSLRDRIASLKLTMQSNARADILDITSILDPVSAHVADERNRELKALRQKGEILVVTHPAYLAMQRIINALDLPQGSQTLVVDSASFLAYYNPTAQVVVISRGVLKYFSDTIPNFSTDHINGVLSHEKQHAIANMDSSENSLLERKDTVDSLLSTHSHAEELRADADGMMDMAQRGSNPRALIEVLKSFGVSSGRDDTAHPETLDRIHHLENRLVDDEHPVPNTNKPMQPVDHDLLRWAQAPSTVYKAADELIRSPNQSTSLAQKLNEADSIEQYWTILKVEQHKANVRDATLLANEPALKKLTNSLIIYQCLRSIDQINWPGLDPQDASLKKWQGTFFRPDFQANFNDADMHGDCPPFFILSSTVDPYRMKSEKEALLFRDAIGKSKTVQHAAAILEQVVLAQKLLDEAIAKVFSDLDQEALPAELGSLVATIKEVFVGKNSAVSLLENVYWQFSKNAANKSHTKNNKKRADLGLRDEEFGSTGIDFEDDQQRQMCVDGITRQLGIHFLPEAHLEAESQNVLALLLVKELGLPFTMAAMITQVTLQAHQMEVWNKYLVALDTKQLEQLIAGLEKFHTITDFLRLSPVDSLHQSYQVSNDLLPYKPTFKNAGYNQNLIHGRGDQLASGLRSLLFSVGWELYTRGYPKQHIAVIKTELSPTELALSIDQWELLNRIGQPEVSGYYDIVCFTEFVRCKESNLPVSAKVAEAVNNLREIPTPHLRGGQWVPSRGQILNFVKTCQWESDRLQKALMPVLHTIVQLISTSEDQDVVRDILAFAYQLSSSNGLPQYTDKDDRRVAYRPDEVAALMVNFELSLDKERARSNLLARRESPSSYDGSEQERASILRQIAAVLVKGFVPTFRALDSVGGCDLGILTTTDCKKLLSIVPKTSNETPSLYHKASLSILLQVNFLTHDFLLPKEAIKNLVSSKGHHQAASAIIAILPACTLRNNYLVALWELATEADQSKFFAEIIKPAFYGGPDTLLKSAAFACDRFLISKKAFDTARERVDQDLRFRGVNAWVIKNWGAPFDQLDESKKAEARASYIEQRRIRFINPYIGMGLVRKQFTNLLYRRASFLSLTPEYFQDSKGLDVAHMEGNPAQHMYATNLYRVEDKLLAESNPLVQKEIITAAAPQASATRDVYLEIILRTAIAKRPQAEVICRWGENLLPLFTDACPFSDALAVQVLKAQLQINPDKFANYAVAVSLVKRYLPKASLARNYFLDLIEQQSSLSPADILELQSLRISPEGQEKINQNSPWTLLVSKMGELAREERIAYYFWLTGITSNKPTTIDQLEQQMLGTARDFPKAFAMLTPPERTVIINRLCLGVEGILDQESVIDARQDNVSALQERFLAQLGNKLFVSGVAGEAMFKRILRTVILRKNAAAGTKLLVKITNKLLDAQVDGKEVEIESLVAMMLMEIGIVGKKAAQSLAELEWVPQTYRKALRQSQSNADVVPKRALANLASSAGLLDGSHDIRITSFNRYLGAASNKQACSVTIEVLDEKVGLPLGTHTVVGKFKRPSAQKIQNVTDDIDLAETILLDINAVQGQKVLPAGFLPGIKRSVLGELDFGKEVGFAQLFKAGNQALNDWHVHTPTILFASDDVVLETFAEGISYRDYLDQRLEGNVQVAQKLLHESLRQLLFSGHVHADMQPANAFIAKDLQVTLIDLGMHEILTEQQIDQLRTLMFGLVTGKKHAIENSLHYLGWPINTSLSFKSGQFSNNVKILLRVMKESSVAVPEFLASIINALGKVTLFTNQLSPTQITATVAQLFASELKNKYRQKLQQIWSA